MTGGPNPLIGHDQGLGTRLIAGADEAGRGSLAGPLVAAAVLFDYGELDDADLAGLASLDDSKVHTRASREALYPEIVARAKRVSIAVRSVAEIDAAGLHRSNLAALGDALAAVAEVGCICLIDGFSVPDLDLAHRAVIGGDGRSAAIAAASVIAKVTRDRFMCHADSVYPGWGFAENVGYSTDGHRAAISARGICDLHRRSFNSVAYQQLELG